MTTMEEYLISAKNGFPERSCYIIAEAGVNHNGDISIAKKLIDAAKESGADAVKFQTFKTEEIVCKNTKKAQYQIENTGKTGSQYDLIKSLELEENDFIELKRYSVDKGITFLSTPFDQQSADLLDEINVPLFKIPSGEITNIPLLEHIGKKHKPVILSTGMSTLGDIEDAISALNSSGTENITLLHCTSSYPAPFSSVNLSAMATLRYAFRLPIGYSDHTEGITIPIAAAALGAAVIEKHFTLDKKQPGPDHKTSLEPDELKAMVEAIRNVEISMGNGIKKPDDTEKENVLVVRKSLVAKRDIMKNSVLSEDDVTVKRPGSGIPPKYYPEIIGKKTKAEIKKDELIKWFQIEP